MVLHVRYSLTAVAAVRGVCGEPLAGQEWERQCCRKLAGGWPLAFFAPMLTGGDPATDGRFEVAVQTVHHDADRPSHVELSVVPAAAMSVR